MQLTFSEAIRNKARLSITGSVGENGRVLTPDCPKAVHTGTAIRQSSGLAFTRGNEAPKAFEKASVSSHALGRIQNRTARAVQPLSCVALECPDPPRASTKWNVFRRNPSQEQTGFHPHHRSYSMNQISDDNKEIENTDSQGYSGEGKITSISLEDTFVTAHSTSCAGAGLPNATQNRLKL
ncbi:hypothetical protein EK904_004519 [Melospiza melodia maxima]|nr:hypothetical protein EK904_004519 [Melospiza melodia maxima]